MPEVAAEPFRERWAGPHGVRVELPDVLFLRLDGDVDLEHMRVFLEVIAEFPGDVHVLRDARKSRVVKARAREFMMKQMPKGKVVSFISFGAPFHARTVITMLAKAIRLIHNDSPVVVFTGTEAEARVLIDEIRQRRRRV